MPPVNSTDVAVGVFTVPVQPLRAGDAGFARETPAGRLSLSVVPVSVVFALLMILMDNRLTAPANILVGLKLLVTEGVPVPVTLKVALASLVFETFTPPTPVELSRPGGITLIQFPGALEVTLSDTVQDAEVEPVLAGTVPP